MSSSRESTLADVQRKLVEHLLSGREKELLEILKRLSPRNRKAQVMRLIVEVGGKTEGHPQRAIIALIINLFNDDLIDASICCSIKQIKEKVHAETFQAIESICASVLMNRSAINRLKQLCPPLQSTKPVHSAGKAQVI